MSQNQPKKQSSIGADAISKPPTEPLNAAPFQKGLSSPPPEPLNSAPFQQNPTVPIKKTDGNK